MFLFLVVFPLLLFLTFSVLLFRVSCMRPVAVYFCQLSEITLNLIFTASAYGSQQASHKNVEITVGLDYCIICFLKLYVVNHTKN